MTLYSKRFEKEYEVPENMLCVTEDGKTILRAQYIRELLAELANTIKLEIEVVAVPNPIYCIKATLRDDTGTCIVKHGSVNINREQDIPKLFPIETAESRAIANVGIEYFQFDGRVYSDASIAMDTMKEEPVKPTVCSQPVAPEDDMPDEAPQQEPPKEKPKKTVKKVSKEPKENLGDYIVSFGNSYTKGKKLSELSEQSIEWVCNLNPTTAAAKEAKEKATAYLASKKQ